MTREEKDEYLKSIQQCKIDCAGDIDGFTKWEVEKLLNEIFDDHEAQLKAKDKRIEEYKEAYKLQKEAYYLAVSAYEEIIKTKEEIIEKLKMIKG